MSLSITVSLLGNKLHDSGLHCVWIDKTGAARSFCGKSLPPGAHIDPLKSTLPHCKLNAFQQTTHFIVDGVVQKAQLLDGQLSVGFQARGWNDPFQMCGHIIDQQLVPLSFYLSPVRPSTPSPVPLSVVLFCLHFS